MLSPMDESLNFVQESHNVSFVVRKLDHNIDAFYTYVFIIILALVQTLLIYWLLRDVKFFIGL